MCGIGIKMPAKRPPAVERSKPLPLKKPLQPVNIPGMNKQKNIKKKETDSGEDVELSRLRIAIQSVLRRMENLFGVDD